MNITNLQDIMESFVKNDDLRTLLIDGKWGSGKTYQFREFLKEYKSSKLKGQKKIPIYYISLFGITSLDEIDHIIYKKINYFKRFFLCLGRFFCRMVITENVRQEKIISEVSRQLNNADEKAKIRRRICIVFDDLERLGENVGYVELFGYLNKLLRQDTKFICLCNTNKIGLRDTSDETRFNDFTDFKEKIFDRIICINEKPISIITEQFKELNIKGFEGVLGLFGDNIRNAIKTKSLFKTIKKHLAGQNIVLDDLILLKSCINVVDIIFNTHDLSDEELKSKDYFYEENELKYGKNIAKGIFKLLQSQKDMLQADVDKYYSYILEAYYFDDYTNLDTVLNRTKKNKKVNTLKEVNLFYMNDIDNINYSNSLINDIMSDNFICTSGFVDNLLDLLRYTIVPINDEQLREIASHVLTKNNGKIPDNDKIYFASKDEDEHGYTHKFYIFLKERQKQANNNSIKEEFLKALKTNDYDKTMQIIEDSYFKLEFKNNMSIRSLLKDNHFLLPDFKGTFDYYTWHVCHFLCKHMVNLDLGDDLYNYLLNEAKQNKTNITYVNKIKALCKYNLGKEKDLIRELEIEQ